MATKKKAETKSKAKPKKARELSEAEQVAATKIAQARDKAKAANASARDAEREAKRFKRQADAERDKTNKELKEVAAKQRTERKLEATATEINVRFKKASKLSGQADDHRLSAACRLAVAKEQCTDVGIKFQDWVETNIDQGWQTARKLVAIGVAENEDKGAGALMLEDLRNRNKAANKKSRAAKGTDDGRGAGPSAAPSAPKVSSFDQVQNALKSMKPEERALSIKSIAGNNGLTVVTDAEAKAVKSRKGKSVYDTTVDAFNNMSVKAQMTFVRWAAAELGLDVSDGADVKEDAGYVPDENLEPGDMPPIPKALQRPAPKKKKKKSKK